MKRSPIQRKTPLGRGARLYKLQGSCCGKRTYATRETAEAALRRISFLSDTHRKRPQRVYECIHGAFHLTSKGKAVPEESDKQRAYRLVMERDGGRCILSGATRDLDVHHRKLKGVGGSRLLDVPENLVTLSREDHEWVHRNPRTARDMGLIVSRYEDPAAIPVVHMELGLVLLTPEGGYEVVPHVDGGDD